MEHEQPHRQGSNNKYHCRICKKGFACGRALGGHMRAHGINDDVATDEDAEPPATYELRSNPNRFKTCRACDNCGKEFSSWKSFLEHGRCGGAGGSVEAEVDGSLLSLSRSDGVGVDTGGCAGWSKGKRSRRTALGDGPSNEEDDLAASCLVMLSSARVDPVAVTETEESCASASKEEDEDSRKLSCERMVANPTVVVDMPTTSNKQVPSTSRGLFECKACKRVFTSHQALGGHRASHKKVKGCFAAKLDADVDENPSEEEPTTTNNAERMAVVPFDNVPMAVAPLRKRGKLHECTICHRVFTSGQALGGHKRCHWLTGNSSAASTVASTAVAKLQATTSHDLVQHQQLLHLGPIMEMKTGPSLDLNIVPMPTTTASGTADGNLTLEIPATLCLQDYMNTNVDGNNITNTIDIKKTSTDDTRGKNKEEKSSCDPHDEEGGRRKAKVARLSDLKDVGLGEEDSNWLQVGFGSCTDGSAAHET